MRKFKMILFAVCLLCLLSCSSALAATDVIASGDCGANGDNVTWELTADGVLTINGSGEMKDYNTNTAPWSNQSVQQIIITEGVTHIGAYSFSENINLSKIDFAESIINIGYRSFYSCKNLININLPKNLHTIEAEAFAYCENWKT